MIGIYKIISPSANIYIGQSVDIERRFKNYKELKNCKSQTALYRSFLKYGPENHIFEILCECSESELNEKERYYQDLYSAIGKNGLNCRLTKGSDRSGKLRAETVKKLSEARKNLSESARRNISLAQKNKCKSIVIRQSKTLSKNKKNTLRLKGFNDKRKIKVGVFDLNSGEKLSEFDSIRECARVMNIDRKSISLSCKNIYPYAYGFKFSYI